MYLFIGNALNLRRLSLEDSSVNHQRITPDLSPDSNADNSQYPASILARLENYSGSHLIAPAYLRGVYTYVNYRHDENYLIL